MKDKVFSDILHEVANLVRLKGAKGTLRRLCSLSAEDYAQVQFERLKHDVSEYFGIDSSAIVEKHNKSDKVYAARVVICHLLSSNTTIQQSRMSKMLNKDASQVSKYIKNALDLDSRDPIQRQIKSAIDKFQWQHKQ
tara:strand:- start:2039 stop:2449 length:411 start_codon:yes stop_codon:yes gene_type:complete